MADLVFFIPEKVEDGIRITGLNKKQLLILCNQDNISPAEETMLEKMMAAINHDINEDVKIMWVPGNVNLSLSQYQISWKTLLVFGIDQDQLGLNIEKKMYYLYKLEKGKRVLFIESLVEIQNNHAKKLKLWEFLKKMFI